MKIGTALTRRASRPGVSSCTSEARITTPDRVRGPSDQRRQRQRELRRQREHQRCDAEHRDGRANISWSDAALRRMARQPTADIASAPIAGAERSRPRPSGPVSRMSRVDRQ